MIYSEDANLLKKTFFKIKELIPGDMIWIFGNGAVSQLLGFLSSAVVVRFLDKTSYGLYVAAYNKYSYFATFLGLGFAVTIIQLCSGTAPQERKNAVFRFAVGFGTSFNVIIMLMMLSLGFVMNHQGKGPYLMMMCAYPFFIYLFNCIKNVMRSNFYNNGYAVMCMSNAFFLCAGNIILTRFFGVIGFIIATYIAYPLSTLIGIKLLQKKGFFVSLRDKCDILTRKDKLHLIKYSAVCASTTFVTIVLGLLDITCLEIVTDNPILLSEYKIGLAIPAAMQTVTDCLSYYYHPLLIKIFSGERNIFKSTVKKAAIMYSAIAFVMSVGLFAFAPLIIRIIYGTGFMDAVPIFRILCLHLFVSGGLHKLLNIAIMSMQKVNVSLIFSSLSVVLNFVLDIVMITAFSSEGAAWATCIVSVFITILETVYVIRKLIRTEAETA